MKSKLSIITMLGMLMLIAAPAAALPDMIVTEINSYHNNTGCPAWFNLSNEVDVTVKNNGSAAAGASNASLYIDDVFFGKLPVPGLGAGASATVTFEGWMPIGEDCLQEPCEFAWSSRNYNFTGVADCDNDMVESSEGNNATTVVDSACYNGYMADEPLENVAHGMLHGGVLFTTGDGEYTGLYSVGATQITNYNIELPAGASVETANLNVYYTWHYETETCPQMEVSITNATGTYILPLEKAYNDHKCTCPGAVYVFPWGNYVYDLTDYIPNGGAFTVTVKRTGGPSVCIAAPGVVLAYEDENAPLIEYWINKGADVLMGGRRYPTTLNLAWWECISNATFPASTATGTVVNATVGVVAPWGDSVPDDILFFNGIELGRGVYDGYGSPCSYTIDSLTMKIEGSNAQVGINVSNVTDLYLKGSDNMVSQADDGDNIMACNAFLVVEYEPPEASAPFLISGWVNDSNGNPVNNPDVVITNTNTGEEFLAETGTGSNYYQAVTGSCNVSAGDGLSFSANGGTAASHTVTQAEMDAGGFEQNLTGQAGVCGDVDGMPGVTTNDGRQIFMNLLHGSEQYPLADEWAADCDGLCDGITTNDGRQIFMNLLHGSEQYPLVCCS